MVKNSSTVNKFDEVITNVSIYTIVNGMYVQKESERVCVSVDDN